MLWALPARFFDNVKGNVIIIFALLAPVALVGVCGGIDYARWVANLADLQSAADTAALAGAKELRLANANSQAVIAAAKNRALAGLGSQASDAVVEARIEGRNAIRVKIDLTSESLFGAWAPAKLTHLHAQAVARTASTPTCLIALDAAGKGIDLETAAIAAPGCATYSNSQKSDGLKVKLGTIVAAQTCTAGGAKMQLGVVLPPAITDCPVITDPLASRPPPSYGGCDYTKKEVKGGSVTLTPGVYCEGLKITNGANVTMAPGVYVIQGGELSVDKNATMRGTEVGFYLSGDKAVLDLDISSNINLVAPKDGPMAGIIFFEDRTAKPGREHYLGSRNAAQLLGTLYFPRGTLTIGKKVTQVVGQLVSDLASCAQLNLAFPCTPPQANLAILSAWTIVIAGEVNINFVVNLVLNTNYSSSATPPPAEFGFRGASLTQ